MRWKVELFFAGVLLAGCAAAPEPVRPLAAPPGTAPNARAAISQGNLHFATGQLAEAQQEFEAAVAAQPELAEAHYNLALTLDMQGMVERAREHYLRAANLAPGNKVIWNSPPLRAHGDVMDQITPEVPSTSMSPVGNLGGGGF